MKAIPGATRSSSRRGVGIKILLRVFIGIHTIEQILLDGILHRQHQTRYAPSILADSFLGIVRLPYCICRSRTSIPGSAAGRPLRSVWPKWYGMSTLGAMTWAAAMHCSDVIV